MRAFDDARRHAPGFVVSCGILPEVSESASERLHTIVRDIAERRLNGGRHMLLMQRALRRSFTSIKDADQVERHLTELLASEATAAYLFGLAVGLSIQALPQKLNRAHR